MRKTVDLQKCREGIAAGGRKGREVTGRAVKKAIPYVEPYVNRFRENGKELGSRFGESARMAAKICAEGAESTLQDFFGRMKNAEPEEKERRKGINGKNYALITGASSGIGMVFARRLSLEGYPLILVARRRDRLETLRTELGTECLLLPADLSRRDDVIRLCEGLVGRRIDIFINNAGFGVSGAFLETDLMREVNMIDVNCTAQHILFKYVLHRMEEEGGGRILNVASSAGLFPGGPYMAGYYAGKAYMTSLTRAVAVELSQAGSPVHVSCLCPGPVNTEFNDVAEVAFALPGISAEDCVDCALREMEKGRTVIVPTAQMKALVFAQRLLPAAVTLRMTGAQQRKKQGKA